MLDILDKPVTTNDQTEIFRGACPVLNVLLENLRFLSPRQEIPIIVEADETTILEIHDPVDLSRDSPLLTDR